MATTNKVLGAQVKPGALGGGSPTDLYTVGAATQANVNIFVCNQGAADTFRISIAVAGAALNAIQYIAYDTPLAANSTLNYTGISLGATDKIRVSSASGNCSFTATGIEIT